MAVAADLAALPALAPTLDEVRELAADYNGHRLIAHQTFIDDTETPVSAFLKLRGAGPRVPARVRRARPAGRALLVHRRAPAQGRALVARRRRRPVRARGRRGRRAPPGAGPTCRRSPAAPSASSATTSCAPSSASATRTPTPSACPTWR